MLTTRSRSSTRIAGINSNQDPQCPTKLPKLSNPSREPVEENLQVQSKLCKRCSRIDLDTVLSRSHKTAVGNPVTSLSPIPKWSIDSCLLCSLMYSVLRQTGSQSEGRHTLRSFSSHRVTNMGWKLINTNLLRLEGGPSRYIVPQPNGLGAPVRMLDNTIDFEIVQGWIGICEEFHTKICSLDTHSSVPFLKLIDCQNRQIIPALDNPYVALNYTWGLQPGPQSAPEHHKILPPKQPRTIEDAIAATIKLGLRYLWIDRYCIDQSQRQEVDQQMGMMDLIYQNAQITIVAAAGEDPTHGLPGVSTGDRNTQACATIGKHFLVSTPSNPQESILSSKWKTRAWTYQEALFSRRRLFFTDKQVYYECEGMCCCEALNFPLLNLHRNDTKTFQKSFSEGKGVGLFSKPSGRSPWEVIQRIIEYSRRELTKDSDILNGILGVLNALERGRSHVRHLSRVPMVVPSLKSKQPENERWSSDMGFFSGLCWTLKAASARRPGFPSWSWTGWYGHVSWGYKESESASLRIDRDVKVELMEPPGLTDAIRAQLLQNYRDDTNSWAVKILNSNLIKISGWVTPICILKRIEDRFRRLYEKGIIEYQTKVSLEDGGHMIWRFESNTKSLLRPGHQYWGLHLAHQDGAHNAMRKTGPALMVLSGGGEIMERVGFGWVDHSQGERYDKNRVPEFADDPDDCPDLYRNPAFLESLNLQKYWQTLVLM